MWEVPATVRCPDPRAARFMQPSALGWVQPAGFPSRFGSWVLILPENFWWLSFFAKKQFFHCHDNIATPSRQHRSVSATTSQHRNIDTPHPDGGGLQPQVEMRLFVMAVGEPWGRNEEAAGDYWGN